MSKKLYILDVSGFLFRAYFALPVLTNTKGHASHALYGFIRSLLKLIEHFSPEYIVAVYDGPDNKKSRKEVYSDYKANRTQDLDDLYPQIEASKQFLDALGIPHTEIDGVEADDTIGTINQWSKDHDYNTYIFTSDKDLYQLVDSTTYLINPFKDLKQIHFKEVEEKFGIEPKYIPDLLGLMGDASDNIPGVKGFGAKTAASLIQQFGSLENILKNIDKIPGKKGLTLKENKDLALLSKKLATIDLNVPLKHTEFKRPQMDLDALYTLYSEWNFQTLLKTLPKKNTSESASTSHIIQTLPKLKSLVEKLIEQKVVCVDCETTSTNPFLAKLVGIGLSADPFNLYYIPFNDQLKPTDIIETLKPLFKTCSFIGHHLKYDIHVLAHHGLVVQSIAFDTILASYLLNSNERHHSLDALTLKFFDVVKIPLKSLLKSGKQEILFDEVPLQKAADYCCEDVKYTFLLKQELEQNLKKQSLESLFYEVELPLLPILVEMEEAGVFVDAEKLKDLNTLFKKELHELEKAIFKEAGTSFNLNSPKQLSDILFTHLKIPPLKKTTTGFSTDAQVLEMLSVDYEICALIARYRTLEKLRSTYLETLPKQIDPKTKRIHPTFNQSGTATGRLSCQDPNLQNIPIRTKEGKQIRAAFTPQKKGYVYLSADYSQIELRLLALFSKDPNLTKAFENKADIHAFTASLMFNIPENEVTSEMRYQAKAINFGIIYGQQAFGLSKQLKCDQKTAKAFIQAYFKQYPKVLDFLDHCVKTAEEKGYATTVLGRRREIPDLKSRNSFLRKAAERLAINTPLQGSAADLIKVAMIELAKHLPSKVPHTQMILQIHDELIFEGPKEEILKIQPLIKHTMERALDLPIPLVVNMAIGKNWGEC